MRKEHDLFTRHSLRKQEIQTRLIDASGSSASAQDDHNSSKNLNILIVEDNPIARTALKNILLNLGEEADVAIDGEQAIEKIKIYN